jgi:hypothetical protein
VGRTGRPSSVSGSRVVCLCTSPLILEWKRARFLVGPWAISLNVLNLVWKSVSVSLLSLYFSVKMVTFLGSLNFYMNLKIGFSNPANKLDGILRKITLNPSQDEHCHLNRINGSWTWKKVLLFLELNFFQKCL